MFAALSRPSAAQELFWRQADGPYGGTVVTSLVPFENGAVLAATPGGVYRSDDEGLNWLPYSEALPAFELRAMLRLTDGSVLAATFGDGVFRRGEGMGSWLFTGLRGTLTQCLAEDSTGVIYAGTTGGLMRSLDNGLNWKMVGYFKYAFGGVKALAATKRYVFAATVDGIFRSEDGGLNWEPAMSGLQDGEISVLAVNESGEVYAGTSPSTGLAGLYRSRNDGNLWTRMPLSGNAYQITAIGFDGEGNVYAGGYKMVYRTTDGGNTWDQINAVETSIHAFAFFSDDVLIGTHGRGILRSHDEALQFKESNEGLHSTINDLAIIKGVLYAGTSGGVYASWDYGRSWWLQNEGLKSMNVSALAVDGNGLLIATTRNGIYRLYETPHEWSLISPSGMPPIRDMVVSSDGTMYAGYHSGLFIASKTGIWTQVPLMGPDAAYRDVIALEVDAAGKVFAGSHYDAFRSEGAVPDQAVYVNWKELTMASGNTSGVRAFELASDGYLYAGTTYEGIVRSADGGDTWKTFGQGLNGRIDFIDLENATGGKLFGATYGLGVFEYDQGSNRWRTVNGGLRDLRVLDVAFDDRGYGYAATLGGGLYVHEPRQQVDAEPGRDFPQVFRLEGNYPNPFNPSTTIQVDLPSPASVQVTVYDALGRRVRSLSVGEIAAGFGREIAFEAGDLASGTYLYRVEATFPGGGVRSVTGGMVVSK